MRNYENHTDSRAPKSAAEKIDASVSFWQMIICFFCKSYFYDTSISKQSLSAKLTLY